MSGNSTGLLFKVTTWGESHGPALGAVVEGCPPLVSLTEDDIQKDLKRRKPGQIQSASSRKEEDRVEILSGVFEGRTTGTPIALLIRNKDADSSAYDKLKDIFRPGHGDLTYYKKYGIRDHRGGGRSSGRETLGEEMPEAYKDVEAVVNVVAGAGLARKVARFKPLVVIKG